MKQTFVMCLLMIVLTITVSANPTAGVLDIAHRGYAAKNPESTLQAFRYAIDRGADGLELDVRQSADNVLLVIHDPVITEIGNQRVEHTSSEQAFLRSNVPSLEEVIILAKRTEIPLWIEIKQSHLYPGIIQRLIGLLQKYHYLDRTVIQSFNHQDLQQIHRINPNIRLLALFGNRFEFGQLPAVADFVGLPMLPRYQNLALVGALHQLGKRVIFWRNGDEVENAFTLQQFMATGADGFMLDKPLDEVLNSTP